jgi:ribosomal protein L11 methyltransferase
MPYIELKCTVNPVADSEILIALLANVGYESFLETNDGVLAYIPETVFEEQKLTTLLSDYAISGFTFSYSFQSLEDQNWNAVWESNYESIVIDNRCYIRAPFHPKREDVEYEIVIEPKMSFGTAHHQTTAQMISYLLEEDCRDKMVLDMGTGTGILAIVAVLRGANQVLAIDNDTWAYENCCENVKRNHISTIETMLGDARNIGKDTYHIVLANINRNSLLQDMKTYSDCLAPQGILLLSGFYVHPDLRDIKQEAQKHKLVFDSYKEQDKWVAARFVKAID